ncbi:MAG: GIN domain-containing protein [Chitinophagales bacterium]|jgi:hypothetical protein|nr:DUF2807 domain-containing protein [Sphingobacteriales bacterium]
MNDLKIFLIGLGFVLSTLTSCRFHMTSNEGKGPQIEKVYNYKFTGIEQDNGIESKVFKSDENKIVINAPSDIMEKILVEEMGNDIVHIHVKKNSNISTNKVKVSVYTKELKSLDASSAAEIKVIDTFTSESIIIETTSGAEIYGSFKALKGLIKSSSGSSITMGFYGENAEINASSGSNIDLKGLAKTSQMKASSGSTIDAENYTSQLLTAESSSGGNISASATTKVSAKSSSGSRIAIYKRSNALEIEKNESSGGSVKIR